MIGMDWNGKVVNVDDDQDYVCICVMLRSEKRMGMYLLDMRLMYIGILCMMCNGMIVIVVRYCESFLLFTHLATIHTFVLT